MPVRAKCAVCRESSEWKMASFYWRWTWPSGDRRAYKQWLDAGCVDVMLNRISEPTDEPTICPTCQQPVEEWPCLTLWVTYYIPGEEGHVGTVQYHESCFQVAEAEYLQEAVRLPDRPGWGGGPPAPTKRNPWESWRQQGVDPR